jgi:transposase
MNNPKKFNTSHFKLNGPIRNQIEMHVNSLDMLLPRDHKARDIWEFVDQMDTRPCFVNVNTFFGHVGRSATSPKILFALWLYSILDGNTSARKLEELCKNHNVYKWLAGGVSINRTMLAEFRSIDPMNFEDLLTSCLAVMVQAGLINDTDFAQDGTRVKANAGFNSYRREASLQNLKDKIKAYLKQLDLESRACTNAHEKREKTKEARIANERLSRVDEALKTLEKERALKEQNGIKNREPPTEEDLKDVRASITDPDARKMKMGDGGYRLAFNTQFVTGLDSRVIFGVDVVTTLDPGTSPRMMAKVHSRLKKMNMAAPKNWVADSAYSSKEDLEAISEMFPNCRYYAPAKVRKGCDAKKHQKNDSEAVKKWRDMIGSEEVESLYKNRCSTAEFSNAQVKNQGFREFPVRGLIKVKGIALLHAIAQNICRYLDLIKKETAEVFV